jgi:hypothetical protein
MAAELGRVEAMQAAGHPEVGEVAVAGAHLATLHGGDDLLRQVERQRIGPQLDWGLIDD